jgi:hypothetical protein
MAAYAATLGIDAGPGSEYGPVEARALLAAESIVSDGDVDLRDEYRARAYADWLEGDLRPAAGLTNGRLHEPPGVGLPLLIAPAYALAGPTGAELLVAALLALGFVAAAALARRLVPEPWATSSALVIGLSPPALGWSTAIAPEPVAAAAAAGAALYALRVRDHPSWRPATAAALLTGALPWLGAKFLALAVVCAVALARWLRRRRRRMAAFAALEIVLFSAVLLLTVNERLYGGLTPYAAVADPTGAQEAADYVDRIPRLVTALFDSEAGLLVWAPFGVLAFVAIAVAVRTFRERLSVALPGVVDIEVAAGFLAAGCAAQLLVAAFLSPTLEGPAFPGRELVPALPLAAALCALGLRHAPRIGAALAAATLAASVWLVAGVRLGDGTIAPPSGPVPWSGAEPVVVVLIALAAAALPARELLRDR